MVTAFNRYAIELEELQILYEKNKVRIIYRKSIRVDLITRKSITNNYVGMVMPLYLELLYIYLGEGITFAHNTMG